MRYKDSFHCCCFIHFFKKPENWNSKIVLKKRVARLNARSLFICFFSHDQGKKEIKVKNSTGENWDFVLLFLFKFPFGFPPCLVFFSFKGKNSFFSFSMEGMGKNWIANKKGFLNARPFPPLFFKFCFLSQN